MRIIKIKNKIKKFNKALSIEGDKSLSIRWALIASQSEYKSKSKNLLLSEDVINTLKCLKKLGVKIKMSKLSPDLLTIITFSTKAVLYGRGIQPHFCRRQI